MGCGSSLVNPNAKVHAVKVDSKAYNKLAVAGLQDVIKTPTNNNQQNPSEQRIPNYNAVESMFSRPQGKFFI